MAGISLPSQVGAARLAQEAQPEPVIELRPRTAKMYADLVGELQSALDAASADDEESAADVVEIVHGLIIRIELRPNAARPAALSRSTWWATSPAS